MRTALPRGRHVAIRPAHIAPNARLRAQSFHCNPIQSGLLLRAGACNLQLFDRELAQAVLQITLMSYHLTFGNL